MKKYKIAQVSSFDVENFWDLLFPIGYVHKDIDFLSKVYDDKNKKT